MSESGCPGFKDLQDESRIFITKFSYYQLPIIEFQLMKDTFFVVVNQSGGALGNATYILDE